MTPLFAADNSSEAQPTAASLIAEARKGSYPQSAVLLLKAVRTAFDAAQPSQAVTATKLLRTLPLNNADEYATNLAEIETEMVAKRYQTAIKRLEQLSLAPTPNLRRDTGVLRATAFEALAQPLPAARERIAIAELLAGSQRQDNVTHIWRDLGDLPLQALADLDRPGSAGAFGAWVALANLHYGARSAEDRVKRFNAWSKRWKGTVAALDLPVDVRALAPTADAQQEASLSTSNREHNITFGADRNVRTIALLLPMTGPLSAATRAVGDGFMAALLNASGPRPHVLFIDTTERGIDAAYRQAINHGADFIVGPLDKQELATLNTLGNLAVPTLALNYLAPGITGTANLVQFGLAPEDDAREVAERVFADNHHAVLVLAMRADWASRASAAFSERWSHLGGKIVDEISIASQSEMEKQIKNALLITEAQSRSAALSQALGFNPEYHERHRRDIDAIVLFAKSGLARAINPILKYHFVTEVPVYATSHAYGDAGESDLNGVLFCDTPWHLQGDPLRAQLRSAFPKVSGELGNLYALGVDAFNLQSQLKTLASGGNARINGATGILSMGESNRIVRELSWASIVNGSARLLPNTTQ